MVVQALLAKDSRSDCISLIDEMNVEEYLLLVERAYSNRGGLKSQRSPLKTTSARRIRERMKEDISRGALIPPVVIGLVVDEKTFSQWSDVESGVQLVELLRKSISPESLSIIDGMQRTTSLYEVTTENPEVLKRFLRVEFWIAKDENALIYRMLVLNAGQIPWDVKKQISVVFEPLIAEAVHRTGATRIIEYGQGRRFNPGEYNSSDVAELYISFASRKLSTDSQEVLTDEFTKLDIVESLSKYHFQDFFFRAVDILISLDHAFATYTEVGDAKRTAGRQVFDKQAARVGLIVAIAISVFGRAGTDRGEDSALISMREIEEQANNFAILFTDLQNDQKRDFLKLDVLNETLDRRVGQVGRFERNLFFDGFRILIEDKFLVKDLEVCWRGQL